jgi:hypothetical protein
MPLCEIRLLALIDFSRVKQQESDDRDVIQAEQLQAPMPM